MSLFSSSFVTMWGFELGLAPVVSSEHNEEPVSGTSGEGPPADPPVGTSQNMLCSVENNE